MEKDEKETGEKEKKREKLQGLRSLSFSRIKLPKFVKPAPRSKSLQSMNVTDTVTSDKTVKIVDNEEMIKVIKEAEEVKAERKLPKILGPICRVKAGQAVRVREKKEKGPLSPRINIEAGDELLLFETENFPKGEVYCETVASGHGGVATTRGKVCGRLPKTALLLNCHCWNIYAKITDWLLAFPDRLAQFSENCLPEFVGLFIIRDQAEEAISILAKRERDDLESRNLQHELFRERTPTIAFICHFLESPPALEFCQEFVGHVYKYATDAPDLDISPDQKATCLFRTISKLGDMLKVAPPEILIVIRGLEKTAGEWIRSIFCLRFLCPALVQPEKLATSTTSSPLNFVSRSPRCAKRVVIITKMIQMIANGVDPQPGSELYNIRKFLRDCSLMCTMAFQHLPAPELTKLRVDKELTMEAATLYRKICELPDLTRDEADSLNDFKWQLGPPPHNLYEAYKHPHLMHIREKLTAIGYTALG